MRGAKLGPWVIISIDQINSILAATFSIVVTTFEGKDRYCQLAGALS
jgi:mRNA-degrading endonuclease toxin of MazEF toxin-antitoxin module